MPMLQFRGLWQRVALYEPADTAEPIDKAVLGGTSATLWLQSACGAFVDVRAPVGKSFAGSAEFQPINSHLTWTRRIDARPPAPMDVGRIVWCAPNIIDEFGVGDDDYRETWVRSKSQPACSDMDAVIAFTGTSDMWDTLCGHAMIVHDHAGIAFEYAGSYVAVIAKQVALGVWSVLASIARDNDGCLVSTLGASGDDAASPLPCLLSALPSAGPHSGAPKALLSFPWQASFGDEAAVSYLASTLGLLGAMRIDSDGPGSPPAMGTVEAMPLPIPSSP